MGDAVVRSGFDAHVKAAEPSRNFGGNQRLRFRGSNAFHGYMYFRVPAPRGSTITSATVRVYTWRDSTGSRTLTLDPVASSWTQKRITWNNRPGGLDTPRGEVVIGAVPDGTPVDIDVTEIVQMWASGTPNYGFRLRTNSTTDHWLSGFDAPGDDKPTLTVEWSDAPQAPTSLTPSGGVVGTTHPWLQFDYTDVSGNTELSAVRVQVDPIADESTPAFDSGAVLTASPELDLSATAFTGLAVGVPQSWRVRVQDGAGLWSEWSDWSEIEYAPKHSVSFTNLSSGEVWEPTPPIFWETTGPQVAWNLHGVDIDTGEQVFATGRRMGTETAHTIPAGALEEGHTYRVQIRTFDDKLAERAATVGDPIYAHDETLVTLASDAGVTPCNSVAISQEPGTPWVWIEWERGTTPDSFVIQVDNRTIESGIEPADVFVSGTSYRYLYKGAAPERLLRFGVRAVVNGRQSPRASVNDRSTGVEGVWIHDEAADRSVILWGDDGGSWESEDAADVYTPVNSRTPVRLVSSTHGLSGSLSGLLGSGFGYTFDEQIEAVQRVKSLPARTFRLITGSGENFRAIIGDVTVSPTPESRPGEPLRSVSFNFWQVDDYAL